MNNKYLLVVERSESQLKLTNEDDKYVLEGIFTEIGVKNNNNRIYDEKEILPHINELKKMCEGNKLLGELDHPKSFDISLQNASHIIEDINYDPSKKQVVGRIRLLNTDAGKNARALVDAGVPLHISSRAAGVVENNGHVKIKKMFTYDLVANPGFSNAELKRVNESFGFDNDDNLGIFEVPWSIAENEENSTQQIKENKEMGTKYISVDDFNEYTKLVKNEFESLKKSISESADPKLNEGLVKYTESIAKQVNVLQDAVGKVTESVDGLISHNDYIIENLEKVKNYAEYIGEKTNQGINYSEKLAESVDHLIEYTKMVAEKTDQNIQYTEHIAEKADQNIEYTKYIANESSNRWMYQNHINEQLDNVISHNDYIVEGTDSIIKYAEYLKSETEKVQGYIDYVVKGINENATFTQVEEGAKVEETPNDAAINEAFDTKGEESYKEEITSKISAILEAAKAEKNDTENAKYNFLNFLSESKRNQFNSLSEEMRDKIVNTFGRVKFFSSREADQIWESCFIAEAPKKLDWLVNMPSKFVASWNSLSESQKNAIKAQASIRLLESQYQIDDFWSTRDLREVKPELANSERPLNESSSYETTDAYLEAVRAGFRQRFKR
jgi:hypothetical protein